MKIIIKKNSGKFIVSQNFCIIGGADFHEDIYKKFEDEMFNDDGIGERPIGGGFINLDEQYTLIEDSSTKYGDVPLEQFIEVCEEIKKMYPNVQLMINEPYNSKLKRATTIYNNLYY